MGESSRMVNQQSKNIIGRRRRRRLATDSVYPPLHPGVTLAPRNTCGQSRAENKKEAKEEGTVACEPGRATNERKRHPGRETTSSLEKKVRRGSGGSGVASVRELNFPPPPVRSYMSLMQCDAGPQPRAKAKWEESGREKKNLLGL